MWRCRRASEPSSASALPCIPLQAQAPRCLPCRPGSYAYSWGSARCKHCIAGTYAPAAQSSLCLMCPANWTNLEDGQAACSVPATPAVDLSQRCVGSRSGAGRVLRALCTQERTAGGGSGGRCGAGRWGSLLPALQFLGRELCAGAGASAVCSAAWPGGSSRFAQARTRAALRRAARRYAVLVTFNVVLTGLDPESVLLKVGARSGEHN